MRNYWNNGYSSNRIDANLYKTHDMWCILCATYFIFID